MDNLSTFVDFIQRVDPELRGLTGFACGAVAEGSLREVGSQIVKNTIAIFSKTDNIYDERNGARMPAEKLNKVPLDVGAEFLRKASFVFDEEAQELWANLLCSFVEDPERYAKVKFVSILNDLDSLDALILKRIYTLKIDNPRNQFQTDILTTNLPAEAICFDSSDPENSYLASEPAPAVQISLENLERLSLIRSTNFWTGPSYSGVYRTRLGSAFTQSLHIGARS